MKLRFILIWFFVAFYAASLSASPIDVGSRVQMFVDDHLIENKQNVELRLNPPTKREIVLTTDQPWEGPFSAYYSLIHDGDSVRLYYRGSDEDKITCLAESKDGIHFTRPDFGLFEFHGDKHNNIVWKGTESNSFAPFRDANPDCPPDQKYKAVCYAPIPHHGAMAAMASPDGIRWRRLRDKSILPYGSYDSLNTVSWDAIEKQYRLFDRYWNAGAFKGVRAIETRTSTDFLNWSDPSPHLYAEGVPAEHFYTNATVRCPGAEDHWLSFPMRLMPDRKKIASHAEMGVSDAVFMTSRDAVHWDRTFMEPWVRPDEDQRNWTDRCNMPAWGIIVMPNDPDVFTMYISEHYRWPDNRLRRLTIPRHRFASVHAPRNDASPSSFVTKPIAFTGDALELNYATSAAGTVKVEIQDEAGKAIAGFGEADCQPIYGNEFDAKITWKGGDVSSLAGKPIRLKFILDDADVYAFHFASAK